MIRFHFQGYGEFTRQRSIGPNAWPHFDLLFIHTGHIRLRLRERDEIELKGGESILIHPQTAFEGETVVATSQASVIHFSLDADSVEFRPPFQQLRNLRGGFHVHNGISGRQAEVDIHRFMKLAVHEASPLLAEMRVALLTLILAELSGEARHADAMHGGEAFESVITWATENLHKRPTVEELAQRAGFSSSHFRAMFRRQVGRSIGAFLQDLRIREASRLLRETGTNIKQICKQSGYSELAALYHAFRRRHGMTPAQYRKHYSLRA